MADNDPPDRRFVTVLENEEGDTITTTGQQYEVFKHENEIYERAFEKPIPDNIDGKPRAESQFIAHALSEYESSSEESG